MYDYYNGISRPIYPSGNVPQYPNQMYQQPMMQQGPGQTKLGPLQSVGSIEEVKAAPMAMDGSMAFYLCMAQQAIFTKQMNLEGMPVIRSYRLVDNSEIEPQYVTADMFRNLQEQVDTLRANIEGGMSHATSQPITNNADTPTVEVCQKPDVNYQPNGQQQPYVQAGNGHGGWQKR